MGKLKWIGVVLACLLWPFGALAQQENHLKIGYVDLQRALNNSKAGERARERFKAEVEKMEARLQKRKKEVEKLKEELEKKGLLLNQEQQEAMARDYRQKLRDFERLYKDAREELQLEDRKLTARLLEELYQVVQEIGEREGYTLILEGNNTVVLYGAKAIDLTDQVVRLYDQKGSQYFKTAARSK